jgi:hypothetical protein
MGQYRPNTKINASDGNGYWIIKWDISRISYTFKAHGKEYTGECCRKYGDRFDISIGKRLSYLKAVLKMKKHQKNNLLLDRDITLTYMSDMSREEILKHIDFRIESINFSIKNIKSKIKETIDRVQPTC